MPLHPWHQLLLPQRGLRRARRVCPRNRVLGLEWLEARLPPAHDVLATALPLSFAAGPVAQVSGTLSPGQPQDYSVTVKSDTLLLATAVPQSSPGFEPRLTLYDGAGQLLIQSDQQSPGLASATLEQHLQAGMYFLEVSAAASTSSASAGQQAYQLTTTLTASLPPFAPLPVTSQSYPTSLAVADLGNGHPDIVTANADGTVSVLLGNGDSSFQPAQSYGLGGTPYAVAVADLGNGHPDIVTANHDDEAMSVLLGNGDGTFQTQQTLKIGHAPLALAVADLGNGHPDIVTANADGTACVLLGNGDGTFQSQQTLKVGGKLVGGVAVADLGNGHSDIVTAAEDGTVSVFLGNGNGTFQPQHTFAIGRGLTVVAVADLGNGHPDLVTASAGGTMSVLLGNGDGTFQPQQTLKVGGKLVGRIAVADLGNGHPDLVTAGADGTVSVFLGIGNGTFQPQQAVGIASGLVAVADLGNGHPDIVTISQGSKVSVFLGNGDGTFQPQQTLKVGSGPSAVAVADLGNGHPDIVTANYDDNTVSVFLGNGDGTFEPQQTFAVGIGPVTVAVVDLGNGRPDIVTANNVSTGTVSVLLGNGDGTFEPQQTFAVGSFPTAVAVADLGNGHPDIVTANEFDNTVSVLLGNGDGTFQPQQTLKVGSGPSAVAVADLGNGHPDLVTANADGTVSVLLGNRDGTFQPQQTFAVGTGPFAVAVADLGNGHPDIVTANEFDNTVSVLLGNGDGSFQPQQTLAVGSFPTAVAIADLGNGHPDIITANADDNTMSVLLGNGNGTFEPQLTFAVGRFPTAVTVANLGNGQPDIVTVNHDDNTVSVLMNQGNEQFQSPVVASGIPSQDVPLLQDCTGNGIADAVSLDQNTGQVLFRQGTGDAKDPYAPFVVINPGQAAVDFALVQTQGLPEIAVLDAVTQQVLVYGWSSSAGQFQLIGSFATGPDPVRIASADLTGDGLADIVVANASDNTLTIAVQQAPGTFTTFTRSVGADPSSISFADIGHGDGPPDIVVSDQVSGDVSILLNDARHSFTSQERYRAGQGPFDVNIGPNSTTVVSQLRTDDAVAADFSGDGSTDVVALDTNTDSFTLLRAAGGGSLIDPQQADTYPVGPGAVQVLAGDFLNNGRQDLAVLTTQTNPSEPSQPGASRVLVFLNNGNGTFSSTPIVSSAGEGATGFTFLAGTDGQPDRLLVGNAYGDFLTLLSDGNGHFTVYRGNLDGKPLAVGRTATGQTFVVVADQNHDQVQVYFQNSGPSPAGSSPFVLAATLPSNLALLAPGAVQLVDLNQTGSGNTTLDLVVASYLSNDVLVYPGLPGGGFGPPQDFSVGFEPDAITVGDFTGNGVPDLAVANAGSNDVSILLGQVNSNGIWTGFTHGERLNSGGSKPTALQAGNFTGQRGILDLRVTNAGGQIATLPGIGSNDKGTGFFNDKQPEVVNLDSTIVQSAFDFSTGEEFVVLSDGSLRTLEGIDLIASGVEAISAADGILVAGVADGSVEVMTESGSGAEIQAPAFVDEPSALEALVSGSEVDVYATYEAQEAPVLFSFVVPVLTQLPPEGLTEVEPRSTVAQPSNLPDTNLIVVAVLVQGDLVEHADAGPAESVPAVETFSIFARTTASPPAAQDAIANDIPVAEAPVPRPADSIFARTTASPPAAQDAVANDIPVAEAPVPRPADSTIPFEAPLDPFRRDVEESLRQWLDEQLPAPRLTGMREALQGMLPALADSPDQAPRSAWIPAMQRPAAPMRSVAEKGNQAAPDVLLSLGETAFQPASREADVEVFASVDALTILVVAAWLMDRNEDDDLTAAGW